jgi:hypothetical protein
VGTVRIGKITPLFSPRAAAASPQPSARRPRAARRDTMLGAKAPGLLQTPFPERRAWANSVGYGVERQDSERHRRIRLRGAVRQHDSAVHRDLRPRSLEPRLRLFRRQRTAGRPPQGWRVHHEKPYRGRNLRPHCAARVPRPQVQQCHIIAGQPRGRFVGMGNTTGPLREHRTRAGRYPNARGVSSVGVRVFKQFIHSPTFCICDEKQRVATVNGANPSAPDCVAQTRHRNTNRPTAGRVPTRSHKGHSTLRIDGQQSLQNLHGKSGPAIETAEEVNASPRQPERHATGCGATPTPSPKRRIASS